MLTNPYSDIYKLGLLCVVQVRVHISWFKKNTKYYVKARESGQLKFFLIMKLVETKTN